MGEVTDRVGAVLAATAPFDTLRDEERRRLAAKCRLLELRPRDLLMNDGESSQFAYILLAGHLTRSLFTPDGSRIIVNSTSPVRTFALAAAFEFEGHVGIIEAEVDSEVLAIPACEVRELFSLNGDFALAVAHSMARSSIYQTRVLQELMYPVPVRVARYLLSNMDSRGRVRLGSKATLAGQMATRAETLSRAFATLKREGLIEMEGREVRVLGPDALRSFCKTC